MRIAAYRLLALLLALAIIPTPVRAQASDPPGGTVEGSARGADGEPLAFALVRLLPASPGAMRTTLTRQDGSFRFAGVEPGAYRLRLERIGFETEVSEAFTVAPGGTARHAFRGTPRPLVIAGVSGAAACYTGAQLERDSALAALWREAQKGMETKRAFDAEYVYAFELRQRMDVHPVPGRRRGRRPVVNRPVLVDSGTTTVVNDPRARRPARRQGFGETRGDALYLEVPDGKEILDPDFLTTHCLDAGFQAEGDVWELDFRPVRPDRRRIDVRGTVRIDRRTFQLHSLRLEYVQGASAFITAAIDYRDASVPGGMLRLPVLARFSGRPVGRVGRTVRHVDGRAEYTNYRYVQEPVEEKS